MIPIKKEPEELYETTHVYEKCVFCGENTDMWHEGTNNPVCKKCSKEHKVSELINWKKQKTKKKKL
jgi:hypothetical protein